MIVTRMLSATATPPENARTRLAVGSRRMSHASRGGGPTSTFSRTVADWAFAVIVVPPRCTAAAGAGQAAVWVAHGRLDIGPGRTMWSASCAERWDCALAREGVLGLDFIPL
jgi:hypothetical protein